ncbi:DUF397 domain-containing protein [Streptomyces sp. WAC 04229]|uniref:DUF397 domain-containing protein n=1 Tax=Streptomyces sp. WAC 04229 TaxID=2203206 RepID=UPI003D74EEC9
MPVPNNNSQPPAAWCYSGNQIKRWRTLANVSREALAAAANYAPETISSMERGVRMPSPRLLDIADELCGAQVMLSAAKEYVRRERYSARAVDFIEREREATSLWTYEVALVPGLLQTRTYAKALIDNRIPPLDEETVEERVAARMERQTILTSRKPPVGLSFVLYEAVLRSPLVDEAQLQRLLEVSRLRNSDNEGGACVEVALEWFKSSHSDSEGGNCVEVALEWFKSSHSDNEGGNCVEVARCDAIHVRDSKSASDGPEFQVSPPAWSAFIAAVEAERP